MQNPIVALFAVALAVPLTAQADYLVLAAVPAGDPFDVVAKALADHHRAPIVRFDPADLQPLRAQLIAAAPRHVALVLSLIHILIN